MIPNFPRGAAASNTHSGAHGASGPRRIALVGYAPDYFHDFGAALEAVGFEVFWVHGTHSAAMLQLSAGGIDAARVLDTTIGFDPAADRDTEVALRYLETPGAPRIHDLILMDRVLRHKPHDLALRYLAHLVDCLRTFFTANGITFVSSGRDTALQLVTMLVCRHMGIPWVVPTRMRIPQDRYMFATGHETDTIIELRKPTSDDRAWAVEFLSEFRASGHKPALKAAVRHFGEVLKMLPRHTRLFASLLRKSRWDKGNNYSRYTIPQIVRMYVRRRVNLVLYKARRPYRPVGEKPFCLYALHTQPESSIDVAGSYFSDQIALVTLIARSLPVTHELYVKIHPTDVDGKPPTFYRALAKLPGVRLIGPEVGSRELVQAAAIVFTLTGTIGYEAALLGKNVITIAKNYFNAMPTVYYCDAPSAFSALIDSLIDSPAPRDLHERLISFLTHMKAQSFCGEVNRMYLPSADQLEAEDLMTLQSAYQSLYTLLCSRRLDAGARHPIHARS